MKILDRAVKFLQKRGYLEALNTNVGDWLLQNATGIGGETAAGPVITAQNAIGISAVYACVRLISESIASLPFCVYENESNTRAYDHPLYDVLHDEPNIHMSSLVFRETLQAHLLLWGNAYIWIETDRGGRPIGFWPLPPWRVATMRDGFNEKFYVFDGSQKIYDTEMIHIPAFGFDGVLGLSPIRFMRQALGLSLATEEYGASFFKNSAKPSGVLEHPGKLKDEGLIRLRASWNEVHQGSANASKVAVLEEGMKWQSIGIPPEDAQFLETRKYQKTEIASMFRVPPHMIGVLERSTFGNIEHQGIEYVTYTLRPWIIRWEQEFNRKLFPDKKYFVSIVVDGLMRGDAMARYTSYASGINAGWMTRNEARALENMNPIDGLDEPLTPLNMTAGAIPANDQPVQGGDSGNNVGA